MMVGPAPAKDVNWWKSEPTEALAKGKASGSPIVVFWTSAWSAAASELQVSLRHAAVAAELGHYVPILLDGDSAHGQLWGEKLLARNYPALIVLSPQGREIMRIAPGLHPENLASALKAARTRLAPISEVLAEAEKATDVTKVSDESWQMLAYHAWDEEVSVGVRQNVLEKTLGEVEIRMPARLRVERARMFARWLGYAINVAAKSKSGDGDGVLSADQRAVAELRLLGILSNQDLSLANLDLVLYGASGAVGLLQPVAGPGRTALVEAWQKSASRIADSADLSVGQRLAALIPLVQLGQMDGEVTKELRGRVESAVNVASTACKDPECSVSIMPTVGYLLHEVGRVDQERAYYQSLTSGPVAYVAWSGLSELAANEGKLDAAIDSMRKGYDSSPGSATRLQWGALYLSRWLTLRPNAVDEIGKESVRVLSEVATSDWAFANRGLVRLNELMAKYQSWATTAERKRTREQVLGAMAPHCAKLSTAVIRSKESARSRCEALFAVAKPKAPVAVRKDTNPKSK